MLPRAVRRLAVPLSLLVPLLLAAPPARAASPADVLAPAGCAMAHCDMQQSGQIDADAPAGPVDLAWKDTTVNGSGYGLGCSSNLKLAVCAFSPSIFRRTSLRAYKPDGSVAWSSTSLNTRSIYSAPMIAPDGTTIATDDRRALKVAPDGTTTWDTALPGGIPTSPNVLADGRIVLATVGGPVSVLDPDSGAVLATRKLTETILLGGFITQGYFDTINTPAVRGNRVYVSAQFRDAFGTARNYARLYALDVVGSGGATTIRTAWIYDFAAPSGASPLVVNDANGTTIVIDGRGLLPGTTGKPNYIGVRDLGTFGVPVWSANIEAPALASATSDPRGGVWVFTPYKSLLQRLSTRNGEVLQTIDVDAQIPANGTYGPSSTLEIAGTAAKPVMLLSATSSNFFSSYVTALDLTTGKAQWTRRIDDNRGVAGVPFGQFPILRREDGSPLVLFSTYGAGVRAVG